jgi:Polyphosphate kinase 2 (PPK2)
MHAYEEMIKNTASKNSPWYVVPADNKAFSRIVVASAVINTLDSLNLEYPKVSAEKIKELGEVKKILLEDKIE